MATARHLGIVTVSLMLVTVSTASAQTVVATSFDQMRLIARLGDDITITDAAGQKLSGRLADLSTSSLEILTGGQRRTLSEADVIVIRRHDHAKLSTGAKIGLGVGAALGTFVGLAATSGCRGCDLSYIPTFAAVYGGFGAGIGVGIAALTPTRTIIYESGALTPR
jgi:hypothetical protein